MLLMAPASRCPLGEQVVDDVAVDIGETVAAALEEVGEAGVVDTQELQDGGLKVVDVDGAEERGF